MPNAISFGRVDNRTTSVLGTTAVTGTGTAQVGGAALTGAHNVVTTAASQTAVVLPASWPAGTPLLVRVTSSTTGLVFPPTGGNINGGSANASLSVAQNKPTIFYVDETGLNWLGIIGA